MNFVKIFRIAILCFTVTIRFIITIARFHITFALSVFKLVANKSYKKPNIHVTVLIFNNELVLNLWTRIFRSSHRRCSIIKGAPKKRLWHRCFSVNFCDIFKNTYFTEHLRWLLLYLKRLPNWKLPVSYIRTIHGLTWESLCNPKKYDSKRSSCS